MRVSPKIAPLFAAAALFALPACGGEAGEEGAGEEIEETTGEGEEEEGGEEGEEE